MADTPQPLNILTSIAFAAIPAFRVPALLVTHDLTFIVPRKHWA
jgi:hypothetical protein